LDAQAESFQAPVVDRKESWPSPRHGAMAWTAQTPGGENYDGSDIAYIFGGQTAARRNDENVGAFLGDLWRFEIEPSSSGGSAPWQLNAVRVPPPAVGLSGAAWPAARAFGVGWVLGARDPGLPPVVVSYGGVSARGFVNETLARLPEPAGTLSVEVGGNGRQDTQAADHTQSRSHPGPPVVTVQGFLGAVYSAARHEFLVCTLSLVFLIHAQPHEK
jgi:hypothetical protein